MAQKTEIKQPVENKSAKLSEKFLLMLSTDANFRFLFTKEVAGLSSGLKHINNNEIQVVYDAIAFFNTGKTAEAIEAIRKVKSYAHTLESMYKISGSGIEAPRTDSSHFHLTPLHAEAFGLNFQALTILDCALKGRDKLLRGKLLAYQNALDDFSKRAGNAAAHSEEEEIFLNACTADAVKRVNTLRTLLKALPYEGVEAYALFSVLEKNQQAIELFCVLKDSAWGDEIGSRIRQSLSSGGDYDILNAIHYYLDGKKKLSVRLLEKSVTQLDSDLNGLNARMVQTGFEDDGQTLNLNYLSLFNQSTLLLRDAAKGGTGVVDNLRELGGWMNVFSDIQSDIAQNEDRLEIKVKFERASCIHSSDALLVMKLADAVKYEIDWLKACNIV